MPLLDLKTNLKSLKFGFDLPAGGSSKQPFVEKPIPSDDEPTPGASPDYLLRQGTLRRIADDETRFFKYFTSTPGLAFIAKQNILSLTSVQTEASRRFSPNQGTYLPTNTLAQLATNPFGGHLNFLGADPTGLIPGISIKKYGDLVNPPLGIGSIAEPDNNRLVSLSKDLGLIGEKPDETPPQTGLGKALQTAKNFLSKGKTVLYSYKGGPGAAEGIGKTNIYRYSNTGFDNPLYTNNPNYFLGKEFTSPVAQLNFGTGNAPKLHDAVGLIDRRYNTYKDDDGNPQQVLKTLGGVSTRYYYLTNSDNGTVGSLRGIGDYDFLINGAGNSPSLKLNTSVYKDKKTLTTDTQITEQNNTQTYTQDQLIQQEKQSYIGQIREDFRKNLRNQTQSPSYSGDKAWDIRTNAGDPGYIGNDRTSYTQGNFEAVDKINALSLYQSSGVTGDDVKNDLIKFRITSIDGSGNNEKSVHMHFRAFIDSFSDSYGAQWTGERYPGRGEEFFRYGGFTRGISLSFTSAAQSKQELIPMYKKLNFLASNTMNDYSNSGYMRPPFIKLTVGGYLYEQFGFIRSLNYGWEMAAPFEIGINDEGTPDSSVKELPHIIKVTGFDFQPIYDFLPQKQQNGFSDSGELTTYGPERYIALTQGGNTNYTNTP
jgi:hypothetical protein